MLAAPLAAPADAAAATPCRFDAVLVVEDSAALKRNVPADDLARNVREWLGPVRYTGAMALVTYGSKATTRVPFGELSDAHKDTIADALRDLAQRSRGMDLRSALRHARDLQDERARYDRIGVPRSVVIVHGGKVKVSGRSRDALSTIATELQADLGAEGVRVHEVRVGGSLGTAEVTGLVAATQGLTLTASGADTLHGAMRPLRAELCSPLVAPAEAAPVKRWTNPARAHGTTVDDEAPSAPSADAAALAGAGTADEATSEEPGSSGLLIGVGAGAAVLLALFGLLLWVRRR